MLQLTVQTQPNGEKFLIAQQMAVVFDSDNVKKILRTIKAEFPNEFRDVHYELVAANGNQLKEFQLPEGR
jgi:hypothetical protein